MVGSPHSAMAQRPRNWARHVLMWKVLQDVLLFSKKKKKLKKKEQRIWHETFVQTTNTQSLVSVQREERIF